LLIWRPCGVGDLLPARVHAQDQSGDGFLVIPQNAFDIGLFLAVILLGMLSQVYRYRCISTAMEQQVKWLLLGVFAAACVTASTRSASTCPAC
jgi:hypothetical protein